MAEISVTPTCRACHEALPANARKFCADCATFRCRWISWRVSKRCRDRGCIHCGTRLLNSVHGKAQVCFDCKDVSERRRWKSRRPALVVDDEKIVCLSCDEPKAEAEYGTSNGARRRSCKACDAVARLVARSGKDRSAEFERRKAQLAERVDHEARARKQRHARRMRLCDRWVARLRREKVKARREAQIVSNRAAKPWLAPGLSLGEKWRLRYRLDPEYHLAERVRQSMRRRRRGKERNIAYYLRRSLKRSGGKITKLESFLGYSTWDLRKHIERQFTSGMSWDKFNDGLIDIDHIIPVSSFDLTSETEVRAAWSITNLRPMWPVENRRKWASRTLLL